MKNFFDVSRFVALLLMIMLTSTALQSQVITITNDKAIRSSGNYWWTVKDNASTGFNTNAYNPSIGFFYTFSADATTYFADYSQTISGTKKFDVRVYIPNPEAFDPYPTSLYVDVYNATRSAKYNVYNVSGKTTVAVDQYANRGKWVSLGIFEFADLVRVTLSDATGEGKAAKKAIAFDAISFVEQVGSINVTLYPSQAVFDGAYWYIDGAGPNNSGQTYTNISTGQHTISFETMDDWTTPANQTITVTVGQPVTASATYTQKIQNGTVTITTSPADATWKINNQTYGSGTTASVPAGTYSVTFNDIAGYETPAAMSITVASGGNVNKEIAYTATTPVVTEGTLALTYSPASISPKVKIDDGAWVSLTNIKLSPGNHTLKFSDIAGFITPENVAIDIEAGETTNQTITYTTAIPVVKEGSISVVVLPSAISAEVSIDGGAFVDPTAIGKVAEGVHTISFKDVPDYITPTAQKIVVEASKTTTVNVTYIQAIAHIANTNVKLEALENITLVLDFDITNTGNVSTFITNHNIPTAGLTIKSMPEAVGANQTGMVSLKIDWSLIPAMATEAKISFVSTTSDEIIMVSIALIRKPVITLDFPDLICENQQLDLMSLVKPLGGTLTGDVEGSLLTTSSAGEKQVTYTVSSSNGLSATKAIKLTVVPTPNITLVSAREIIATSGQKVSLQAFSKNGGVINWENSPENEIYSFLASKNEWIHVASKNECGTATDSIFIKIQQVSESVTITGPGLVKPSASTGLKYTATGAALSWQITPSNIAKITIQDEQSIVVDFDPKFNGEAKLICSNGSYTDTQEVYVVDYGDFMFCLCDTIKGANVFVPGDTIKGENIILHDTVKGSDIYIPGRIIQLKDSIIKGKTIVLSPDTVKPAAVLLAPDTIFLPPVIVKGETIIKYDTLYVPIIVEMWESTTSVNQTTMLGIKVFPIPATKGQIIQIQSENVIESAALLTLTGQRIEQKWPNSQFSKLNAPETSGTFIIEIATNGKQYRHPIIIQ